VQYAAVPAHKLWSTGDDREEGWLLSWLFIVGLGIIWASFLLPSKRGTSPVSTVEAFEKKMDMLAETNGASPGRWVLVPRKGERFLGSRDRNRVRVRRRRRQIFSFLLESTGLTLLIGLFPPLRLMLVGTAVLGAIFVLYLGVLMKIKADEAMQVRLARARRNAALAAIEQIPAEAVRQAALAAGYGYQDQYADPYPNGLHYQRGYRTLNPAAHADGNGNGTGNGHNANGNGNGHSRTSVFAIQGAEEQLLESGVRILDDVHVVLRRRMETEQERELQAAVQ
jgi:hypothetical protein